MRQSTAATTNPLLKELSRQPGEGNAAWGLRAAKAMKTANPKAWTHLVLFGGSDLLSFRVRVAQSHLRQDMLPSFWSDAALIVLDRKDVGSTEMFRVPLLQPEGTDFAAWSNGVVATPLSAFDDAARWPNVALIAMPVAQDQVLRAVGEFMRSRDDLDALALVLRWLAFAWGSERAGNPLHDNCGLPSACMLESVFAREQFDLTPGIESRRSCPESIWAAAKRWHEYYGATAARLSQREDGVPVGRYVIDHQLPIADDTGSSLVQRLIRGG